MRAAGEAKAVGQCPAEMVAIPAGRYKGKQIAALCVDRSEGTNGKWDRVMESGYIAVPFSCPSLAPMSPVGRYATAQEAYAVAQKRVDQKTVCGAGQRPPPRAEPRSPSGFDRPNQPRVMIDAYQAKNFCAVQGKRLLTPDEWAYVASKGGTQDHSTRDGTLSRKGIVYCDSFIWWRWPDTTADVGSLAGNYVAWGGQEVWDLNGNVWEWTSYDPATKEFSVVGGAWNYFNPWGLVADDRSITDPDHSSYYTGVRCAKSQDALPDGQAGGK